MTSWPIILKHWKASLFLTDNAGLTVLMRLLKLVKDGDTGAALCGHANTGNANVFVALTENPQVQDAAPYGTYDLSTEASGHQWPGTQSRQAVAWVTNWSALAAAGNAKAIYGLPTHLVNYLSL